MKFLADEGVESMMVKAIRDQGYDITYIVEMERGISDEEVLKLATTENRILITRDKDFGELAFFKKKLHSGIILNRLAGLHISRKIEILLNVLNTHEKELYGSFTVIQPGTVRIRKV
ncbi:MAG: DUF5615 family PIN-like protein [Bacteroidota bacterium]